MGEKLIASSAVWAAALSSWKMKNLLEIWCMMGSSCCNSITLRLLLFTDLDSVSNCVMSITCDSPTDVISDWTLITCTGVLSRRLSSWLMDTHTVCHSQGFSPSGRWKRLFVSRQNDANIIRWIFLSNWFEWLSLAWEFAAHRCGAWQFLSTSISQGSVAMCLRCGGIFNYCLARNLLRSL